MKNANQHITNSNAFTYDGNGNILTQIRNNHQGTTIDSLTYKYRYNSDNKLIRNRLYHLKDAVHSSNFSDDIDDQGNFNDNPLFIETANNYVRDKMGRLVKDKQEYIDTILWTATNKVKAVIKTPSDTLKNVYFDYDAFGNQIAKHVYNSQTAMLEKSTYYLLDAQSNQLSIYEHTVDENESTAKYYLAERNIYGSSRLGSSFDTINMFAPEILPSYGILGNRNYELSDHRNNIYTVISDIKYPISSDNTTIDSYEVGIVNIADYSPFGVQLDGRTFENDFYRRSFQNQEHHDEIKGKGNYINYKYRGYDPRIGRLDWTLDPLAPKYPELTPYQFSSNRVLDGVELEGLEVHVLNKNEELPDFKDADKYNVGETFVTPDGNFYENKEWHGGYHYKGFEDVTEDYTATINCNCPKEPSKFSKVADNFRKWENKYFGEGNDDPANTGAVTKEEGKLMSKEGVIKISLQVSQVILEGIQRVAFPIYVISPEDLRVIPANTSKEN